MKKKIESKDSSKTGGKNQKKKDFLVVGLGASAGGVKALQEFFATMPPDSGMAFVAILHLSPEHESSLAPIIQAQTGMKVTQVTETVKVEPNNVYVIPPNVQLEMVDGVIRPKAVQRPLGHRIAIDVFFRTLAEAYEKNAVCIVLSGTGSDGTLGLKRVKESNGFAIVQDPEDAEYDSMPRSAINTQLADWILPVHKMPDKLIHFRESSERLYLTNGADAKKIADEINAEESLREILTVLRVRTGHDFSNYKTPTLIRRIARHLQIHELEDIPTYLTFLRDNPDEVVSLQRNLLINVTNFFRDKAAFDALEKTVIPKLFSGKTARDTVRIWSAGCASGEEAYSLAMLLSEYAATLTDPPKFQVFATDVDDEAITEAREHSYPEAIEADVSSDRLKRFFVREGKRYRVKKELRETILFAPHNILRDPPFSRLDLIVCRNVLIYLNRDTQERVMEIFHFALTVGGYLFLGSSETAENALDFFAVADKKQRIYTRRAAHHNPRFNTPQLPVAGNWQVSIPNRKEIRERNKAFSLGEVHYKLLERFAPPSALVNRDFEVLYMSENVSRYLRFSGGELSNSILKLVLPELLPDLRAALFMAQQEKQSSEFPNIHLKIDGEEVNINLIVRTVDVADVEQDLLLIVFEEIGETQRLPDFLEDGTEVNQPVQVLNKDEAMESVVQRLEGDLQRTRLHLRSTVEQHEVSVEELKASNEELQAINEELRSASEELETSKEELQSVNEELTTVNHELKEKIDETTRTNSDLQNLMAATDIATIFLDKTLKIKRYTPPVEEIFNIARIDIGRPLAHFTHKLNYDRLESHAADVLKSLISIEHEITDREGRAFLARFAPYRTLDDRIDGVVLNFIDITERKRAENLVAADLQDTQILHELSTRLVKEENIEKIYNEILSAAISITRSDAGTVQIFDADAQELVLLVTKNIRRDMRDRFQRVDAGSKTACGIALKTGTRTFVDFDDNLEDEACLLHVENGLLAAQATPLIARAGKPIGMLNTHWREAKHRPTERELRFLDILARQAADIIEQRQAEQTIQESEARFRSLVHQATAGICRTDLSGALVFVNETFVEMLGYDDASELLGKTIWDLTYEADAKSLREEKRLFKRLKQTGETFQMEKRLARRDDSPVWVNISVSATLDAGGKPQSAAAVVIDIGDSKHAEEALRFSEAWLAGQKEAFQLSLGDAPLHQSLGVLVRTVIEQTDAEVRCAFYVADESGKFLKHIVGMPKAYAECVDDFKIGGDSLACGLAAYTGEPVITPDVHEDSRWTDWRWMADKHDYRGVWSFPIETVEGKTVGTFAMYFRQPRRPKKSDFATVSVLTQAAAVIIARKRDTEARARAEAVLRESETKYRMLFGKMDEGFCIIEVLFDKKQNPVDYRFIEANPALYAQTGFTEDVIGKTMLEVAPGLEKFWFDIYGEIALTGEPKRFEHEAEVLNRWYDVYAFRVGEPQERKVAVLFNDIARRLKAEEIVRESEERLRIAVEAASMGTWDWDLTTDEIIWNERHFILFGMEPSDEPQTSAAFYDRVHPDDRERVGRLLKQAIRTDRFFEAEFCIIREDDKKTRWMEGYGHVVEKVKGKPTRMSGVMSDITERKNAEIALRESQTRLELLMESVKDYAIITTDLKGIVLDWNAGAENIFGWTADEIVGKSSDKIFTPEDRKNGVPDKERETARRKGRAEDERFHIRKDSTRFYVSGMMTPLKNGELEGYVKIARDQTEKRKSEKALLEKEMLSQFVQTQEDERRRIARELHDQLGQQLTALRFKINTLKKTYAAMNIPDKENAVAQIEDLQKTSEQIDRDVDFLAWELRPSSLEDLGLRLTLQNFVAEWSKYAGVAAEFHTTGMGRTQLSHVVETNIYRTAQEALNNVLKHARATKVSVMLEKRREIVVLIVEDDGIGFNVKGRRKGAKGLGLVGMAERATLMGGDFEIESEKGKGTTIYARIPVNTDKSTK